MSVFLRLAMLVFVLVLNPVTVRAGGSVPQPLPDDLREVQNCLTSRNETLASTCIGLMAERCLVNADSQQRMTQCMLRERAVWDLFLNNDFQAITRVVKGPVLAELREIQRNWIQTVDRTCTFIRRANGYSSYIQVVEIEKCAMRATAVQWLWLRDFTYLAKPEPDR